MYQNPANDVVHFNWLTGVHVLQVFNSMGQIVAQETLQAQENTWTSAALPAGVYTVKVTDQSGRSGLRNLVIAE